MKNTFLRFFPVAAAALLLISCDKDFNEIGADIIGNDHFLLTKYDSTAVSIFDQKYNGVQTNNLPVNALGIYNNPVFGKTKASYVTQLELVAQNPTFGNDPEVTKVVLSVPYASQRTAVDDDGAGTYDITSLYGDGKFKLSVYENNYYLRDYDPTTGFQEVQKFYSDQSEQFDNNHGASRLNDDPSAAQNDEFFFDDSEIVTYETNDEGEEVVADREGPGMRLNLNKDFFQQKIFGASASGQLINNNAFKQYFKGLYFKVEEAASSPVQGSMSMIDFTKGKVTVTYLVDGEGDERVEKTMEMTLTGNTVNLYENLDNPNYIANVGGALPDERIYLKGGAGSSAVIDLFAPGQLEELRERGWLVNDAALIFYIDQDAMTPDGGDAPEPRRIYLYDIDNQRPLVDYFADVTTVSSNPKDNRYIHGGIIEKPGTETRGTKYRIRLTNHIRNLLNRDIDSTNVRLGLAVTEDINTISMAKLSSPNANLKNHIPVTSVYNPLGTVIYGNLPPEDENYDKRLRLEIYYTKEITD